MNQVRTSSRIGHFSSHISRQGTWALTPSPKVKLITNRSTQKNVLFGSPSGNSLINEVLPAGVFQNGYIGEGSVDFVKEEFVFASFSSNALRNASNLFVILFRSYVPICVKYKNAKH
ncbi:hypothetical protein DF3PA_70107 [Candidatus Defluviicoccus seviourii]|uniref:Uncharacterized protein n=1 Tax=Candidatus Defluviicoccus seviourii TaxID=2565273 RepID=A0A564WH65_9PROT|nr:hypothetical protein DF3PA_70107 [Candidatus Defluviicoccus seviourii]